MVLTAMRFLQEEIELLAEFTGVIQEHCDLLEVAVETESSKAQVLLLRWRELTIVNSGAQLVHRTLQMRRFPANQSVLSC